MPKRTTQYRMEGFPQFTLFVKSGKLGADGQVKLEIKVTEAGNGRNIAEGVFVADTSVSGYFEDFYVTPSRRRQGIATAVYDKMEEIGFDLRESDNLDGDGHLFWESRNEMRRVRQMAHALQKPYMAAGF